VIGESSPRALSIPNPHPSRQRSTKPPEPFAPGRRRSRTQPHTKGILVPLQGPPHVRDGHAHVMVLESEFFKHAQPVCAQSATPRCAPSSSSQSRRARSRFETVAPGLRPGLVVAENPTPESGSGPFRRRIGPGPMFMTSPTIWRISPSWARGDAALTGRGLQRRREPLWDDAGGIAEYRATGRDRLEHHGTNADQRFAADCDARSGG